jgi:hypothetical protein
MAVTGWWFFDFNLSSYNVSAQLHNATQTALPSSEEEVGTDTFTPVKLSRDGSGDSVSVASEHAEYLRANNLAIQVSKLDLLEKYVPITIRAGAVQEIEAYVRNIDKQVTQSLGRARKTGPATWSINWDVESFPGNSYRVLLDVTNNAGISYRVYNGSVHELPRKDDRLAALAQAQERVGSLYESLDAIEEQMEKRSTQSASSSQGQLYVKSNGRHDAAIIHVLYPRSTQLELRTSGESEWVPVSSTVKEKDPTTQVHTLSPNNVANGWYTVRAVDTARMEPVTPTAPLYLGDDTHNTTDTTKQLALSLRVPENSPLTKARVDASALLTLADVSVSTGYEIGVATEAEQIVASIITEYQNDINTFSDTLADALRSGKQSDIKTAIQNFRSLERVAVQELEGRRSRVIQATEAKLHNRINLRILRTEQAVAYIETTLKTDSASTTLSTKLLDPEVSFFATSNSSTESERVSPAFRQPRTSGITRDDLLSVEAIATTTSSKSTTSQSVGVLRGTALPNSTVRLFIYSNPVVVTLKTNSDGTWEYKFDTELSDGTHEVFVALTDGAGQVVAKSSPFRFSKTANAFTPIDQATVGQTAQSNNTSINMLNWPLVYLVVALSVVVIGFLIILLGVMLGSRRDQRIIMKTKIIP